jgi:toxin secretion/phage lysis holin
MNYKFLFASLGGIATCYFGGWDVLFQSLCMLMVLDWLTGMLAAYKNKELSSKKGLLGASRKVMIIALVAVANQVDVVLGKEVVRNITLVWFIGNEGLSIIENSLTYNIRIPKKLKESLKSMLDIFNK